MERFLGRFIFPPKVEAQSQVPRRFLQPLDSITPIPAGSGQVAPVVLTGLSPIAESGASLKGAARQANSLQNLSQAGLLDKRNKNISKKGTGFVQPLQPHEHWLVDISYLNICGTFYYLCSLLNGCSRFIVHWEIRKRMLESPMKKVVK